MRAVTRVNTVQASKNVMRSRLATITRKAAAVGEASEIRTRSIRRGSGDGTCARELVRNKGSLRWALIGRHADGNDWPARDGVGPGRWRMGSYYH